MAALGGTLTPSAPPTTIPYGAFTPGTGLALGGTLSLLLIDPTITSGPTVPTEGIIWPNGVNA